MENEKEKKFTKPQIFYFNEQGQLVVESNKGIWVDGEQYVKMYGNFTCSAKTMGIIINKFNGFPVVVQETTAHYLGRLNVLEETSAIVNPTDDDKGLIRQKDMLSARNNNLSKQVEDLKEEIEDKKVNLARYWSAIEKFNKQPWWKRIFKKVEV